MAALPNIFTSAVTADIIQRIDQLKPDSTPKWGKMTVSQMLLVNDDKDFDKERKRLIEFINKTTALGEAHFDNKASHSFGVMNKQEWNNMFYKHLDHHLAQFGV